MTPPKKSHRNKERVVKCPVEGCAAEKLARGIHLHVLQSAGNGHGEQGEIPDGISFDDLEDAGTQKVEVNYPEEREVESVARLCPYCSVPFKGKHGVLIHLGQVAGRKNHPPNASRVHEPEDFPIVKLDDDENIISVVDNHTAASPDNEPDEARGFRDISKEDIDYLYRVVSKTGDSRAKQILRRACLSLNL